MTPDRRSLGLPAFSEPAADAPVPAQSGVRPPLPVAQGADFRQPPGETATDPAPAPAPVRHRLAAGGPTFSDPARQI
ncbi:hypothetical protein ACIBJD_06675 [Kitasatospora sp. NPDC050467]|uniref:hypothetical protein n=1 Tax=Kitasatospora sp. NPDC050467 TaxID=3364053 RepID=UPI00378DAFD2